MQTSWKNVESHRVNWRRVQAFLPAYVSNVIAGKKGISANFARGLEYAIGVPKSFWLNLQANYEAELLEANELQTITEEERIVREDLKEIVKYFRERWHSH